LGASPCDVFLGSWKDMLFGGGFFYCRNCFAECPITTARVLASPASSVCNQALLTSVTVWHGKVMIGKERRMSCWCRRKIEDCVRGRAIELLAG